MQRFEKEISQNCIDKLREFKKILNLEFECISSTETYFFINYEVKSKIPNEQ